ncbi:MAG: MATE family efflux transporter, partial [Myxococcales bacterium]|nr:MATE family efflux transporter [Myxococcales bacterium]
LSLLAGFAWFTNASARFGEVALAGNHVLLQLVSFSAFVLDGFAFATEAMVGRALGAGDRGAFDHAVRRNSELAAVTAGLLALAIMVAGELAVDALTRLPLVRQAASAQLWPAAVYVALSVAAFQLDGVFIGASRTRAMRRAALAALAGFIGLWWLLAPYGNRGLWWAFVGYVVLRALTLGLGLPALRRSVGRVA